MPQLSKKTTGFFLDYSKFCFFSHFFIFSESKRKSLENELLIVKEQNQENLLQFQTKFEKLFLEKNDLENQM